MSPIPIALYAVQLEMARKVKEAMLPEYDVVHVVLTRQAAEDELRPLMAGDATTPPSSEVGSNATRPAAERSIPRVLAFSTAVPEPEVQAALRAARVPAGSHAQPDASEVRACGSGQDPGAYAKALKAKLRGMGIK